jgi:ankyrin repeat protein
LTPTPTSAQVKDIDKLNQKLIAKLSSKAAKRMAAAHEEEDGNGDNITFDLKEKSRVILFEGPLLKRSLNSMIQHTSKRYGYLLNDVLLVTTVPTTSSSLVSFNSVERINIQQFFYLDQISITNLKEMDPTEDPTAFEILAANRPYYFMAETEADKKIWMEELEAAIFCILSTQSNKPGWFHEIIRGTLHSAAYLGDDDLLDKFISRLEGQSLDEADESGMTALHWASLNGHVSTVEKLIAAGADIDRVNGGLNSSLLLAAAFGHRDVIFTLLDHGADMSLRNLKDHDCLMMSVTHGSYGTHLSEIIMALKYRGLEVNRQDISGSTPLHECSSRSLPLSIQALVDAGADVNCPHGRTGLTPLQLACSSSKPDAETIRSLLDKGALPNWKDTLKRTSFEIMLFTNQVCDVMINLPPQSMLLLTDISLRIERCRKEREWGGFITRRCSTICSNGIASAG